jgi:large subunit ribosomal protein L10
VIRLAISKQHKNELVAQYQEWLQRSQAAFVAEYVGLNMKGMGELRRIAREKGGEFHVTKNTLILLACKEAGFPISEKIFEGSTAIGFAFDDVPGLAKALTDFAKTNDSLKLKGGFLGKKTISSEGVKALADLPPLPVVRAQLIGTIQAPASKLARLLKEPGRQIAGVLQAKADKEE